MLLLYLLQLLSVQQFYNIIWSVSFCTDSGDLVRDEHICSWELTTSYATVGMLHGGLMYVCMCVCVWYQIRSENGVMLELVGLSTQKGWPVAHLPYDTECNSRVGKSIAPINDLSDVFVLYNTFTIYYMYSHTILRILYVSLIAQYTTSDILCNIVHSHIFGAVTLRKL